MSKQKEPTKKYTLLEIYNSYHWLITHVEPFKEILPLNGIPYCVPRCFDEPLKEIGIPWIILSIEDKDEAVIPSKTPGEFFYNLPYVNVLFKWCLRYEVDGKKIPFLYLKDATLITSTFNVKKIWIERGIENKDTYSFHELRKITMIVEDYLFLQHEGNQEKLSQPEAEKGAGEKDTDYKDLVVEGNKATGELTYGGKKPYRLEALDVKLLELLVQKYEKSPDRIVLKKEIMNYVWGDNYEDGGVNEDQLYIRKGNLDKAFKKLKIPAKIATHHGRGYALTSKKSVKFVIK